MTEGGPGGGAEAMGAPTPISPGSGTGTASSTLSGSAKVSAGAVSGALIGIVER